MRCHNCQHKHSRVLDSRPVEDHQTIRRRRECEKCGNRFTTFERVEDTPLMVIKKEGVRESFSREKLTRGLVKACEKRPITLAQLEELSLEIEKKIRRNGHSEVSSNEVGELVMEGLSKLDEVAYVRFASVYRQFKDINVFLDELKELIRTDRKDHNQ